VRATKAAANNDIQAITLYIHFLVPNKGMLTISKLKRKKRRENIPNHGGDIIVLLISDERLRAIQVA